MNAWPLARPLARWLWKSDSTNLPSGFRARSKSSGPVEITKEQRAHTMATLIHNTEDFPSINRGYNRVFKANRLSLGLVAPLESYMRGPVPTIQRLAENLFPEFPA